MMKPLRVGDDGEQTTYACIHWRNFPSLYAGLRKTGVVTAIDDQRLATWERECGLLRMAKEKCMGCVHVRRLDIQPHQVPKLVTLDGEVWTPAVDIPQVEAMGKYRRVNMKQRAREAAITARQQAKPVPEQ